METLIDRMKNLCVMADRYSDDAEVADALDGARRRWDKYFELAEANRVLSQIGRNLRKRGLGGRIPGDALDEIVDRNRRTAAWNMLVAEEGRRILDGAAARGLGLIPLKGVSLIGRIYSADERDLTDIDFLVRGEDAGIADSLMRELGYAAGPPHVSEEFDRLYAGEKKYMSERSGARVDVEIHWDPSPGPAMGKAFPLKPETLWGLAEREGASVRLSPEGELLYLIHHLAARHSFGRLMWFLDIHYLMKEYGSRVNIGALIARLKEAGLENASRCVFYFLREFLGAEAPGELAPEDGAGQAAGKVMTRIVVESMSGWGLKRSGLVPGLIADRKADYFINYLFPDNEFLEMRYPDIPPAMRRVRRIAGFLPWISGKE